MGIRDRLGTGAKFGQTFLILVNIAFAVLGLGLIILGAYVRLNKAVDGRIIEFLKTINIGGLNLGDVVVVLSAFVIVVGAFTLIVAANGGFGACLKKKGLLILYVIILILILLIELAIFIVWCKFLYGTDNWLKSEFMNVFRFYNGERANDIYSNGLNSMFMLLDCCGVSPITTFQNDFQQLNTFWWLNVQQRGFNRIPYTCCKDSNVNNYRLGQNPQCTMQLQFYRRRGCYGAVKQMFTDVSAAAIALSVILIVTEVLALIAAILLIVRIDREKKQTLDTTNGSVYKKGVHDLPLPDSKPR